MHLGDRQRRRAAIRKVYDNWQGPEADRMQADITALRKAIQAYPMIPVLKALIAHYRNDPAWAKVRPPFVAARQGRSRARRSSTLAEAHGFKLSFDEAA